MGPRTVFLTVVIAAIFSTGVIHLGQRWLSGDGAAVAASAGRQAPSPGELRRLPMQFASGDDWLHR